MNWLDDLKTLKLPPLSEGKHKSPEDGLCAMEMVAYMERLPHSDAPECTCPLLREYVIKINDMCSDSDREKLKPYLPRLVGTVSPAHEQVRAGIFAWAAIHRFAPMALDQVALHHEANALRRCSTAAAALIDGSIIKHKLAKDVQYSGRGSAAYESLCAALHSMEESRWDMISDTSLFSGICAGETAATGAQHVFDIALDVLDEAINVGPSGGWTNYSTDRARELERAN